MSLEGRVALVTGATGSGVGRSIALTLARDGAAVVVNYRQARTMRREGERMIIGDGDKRAAEVAAAIERMGRRALAYRADVTDAKQVRSMFDAARAALGAVDIVVASAGGPWKPQEVTEVEPGHLRRVLAAEIESVYHLLAACLPAMRDRSWGRVLLVGGHMADDWRFGPPDAPLDYPLGKAARHWLARTLGPREAAHGVTINAVAPGPMERLSLDDALSALEGGPEARQPGSPQAVAEVVAFLCSEAGGRVTGAVLPVPGARPV
jgi:NAD(P)-dependent dehydrogenase (short-subunit alcohol dehydrogenase family)